MPAPFVIGAAVGASTTLGAVSGWYYVRRQRQKFKEWSQSELGVEITDGDFDVDERVSDQDRATINGVLGALPIALLKELIENGHVQEVYTKLVEILTTEGIGYAGIIAALVLGFLAGFGLGVLITEGWYFYRDMGNHSDSGSSGDTPPDHGGHDTDPDVFT